MDSDACDTIDWIADQLTEKITLAREVLTMYLRATPIINPIARIVVDYAHPPTRLPRAFFSDGDPYEAHWCDANNRLWEIHINWCTHTDGAPAFDLNTTIKCSEYPDLTLHECNSLTDMWRVLFEDTRSIVPNIPDRISDIIHISQKPGCNANDKAIYHVFNRLIDALRDAIYCETQSTA